jgi:hypothetical protein
MTHLSVCHRVYAVWISEDTLLLVFRAGKIRDISGVYGKISSSHDIPLDKVVGLVLSEWSLASLSG